MSYEARIRELGIAVPPKSVPGGAYVPAVRAGNLVFTSGQTPKVDGQLIMKGKLGGEITIERGQEGARIALLNALAAVRNLLGNMDAVDHIVRMTGFVSSAPGFHRQPEVLETASLLLREIFGDAGAHARALVGVAELPGNAPVEVELIVAVKP